MRGEVFRAQAHKQGNWRQLVGHHIIVCARVVLELVQAHIAGANIDQEIMRIFLVIGCIIAVGINECCGAQAVGSCGRSPLNDKETLAIGIGVVVVNIALQIGGGGTGQNLRLVGVVILGIDSGTIVRGIIGAI